jgi:DNA-binding CsgD family transcriptional regulator
VYGAYRRPGPVGDEAIDLTVAAAHRFEYEWAVRLETERRLRELGDDLRAVSPAQSCPVPASANQQVRDIYAELVHIASTVPDDTMRDRIEDLLHRIECRSDPTENAQGVALVRLSRRQIDVLTQVALGCSNHEVAARLGLVPSTVKSYLQSAYQKLDVSNRTEAVAVARRSGLIP